ncbi:contractile injection system tape measure protein [Chitinophaga ginsengisegetis]|uniref:contractile injection system tape measure protein n=1 Tax=Chitinophaga ginsengisegetis TaxID=393003 RepID=UPI000DB9961C|nr:contractile injection system tape measure protein [Chitinophaga ginsengisegetis]MDR6568072.1 hypothetical protein [Chitinophaga ginsengisegetis]MDR6647373.1 hypothetical protein [Chitinophaga ginsengisegetis]MDR6653723.1 hypothetical protein [Chitinophaga ginsengisegetis]
MLHKIRKQTLLLTVHNKDTVFTWQHQVTALYWNKIIPALEKLFDSHSSDDTVIYIDRLEIDLGKIKAADLNNDHYVALLLEKMTAALATLHVKEMPRKSLPEHTFDQWCYYMEHGTLPWNAARPGDVWYQQVLQVLATSHEAITTLRKQLLNNPDYLRRILMQHSPEFITQLLAIITAKKQDSWASAIHQLYDAYRLLQLTHKGGMNRRAFEQACWYVLLVQAAKDPTVSESAQMNELLIGQPVFVTQIPELITVCRNNSWDKLLAAATFFNTQHTAALPNKQADTPLTNEASADPETGTSEEEISEPTTGAHTYYVVNAGIILLHHWLLPMFRQLEWTDGKRFLNAACKQQAIMLLHYMATGQTEADEFEVVLPKLLCGWPLKRPLDTKLAPTEEAMEEADGLIENAISHWKALKNISADGLREGFLQRPGRLITGTDKHQLQMESDTIDILLDRLPWNISIIKLKWMKIPLHVQWR